MFCKNCNQQIPDGTEICPYCKEVVYEKPNKKKKVLMIMIAALCVIGICVVVFQANKNKKQIDDVNQAREMERRIEHVLENDYIGGFLTSSSDIYIVLTPGSENEDAVRIKGISEEEYYKLEKEYGWDLDYNTMLDYVAGEVYGSLSCNIPEMEYKGAHDETGEAVTRWYVKCYTNGAYIFAGSDGKNASDLENELENRPGDDGVFTLSPRTCKEYYK